MTWLIRAAVLTCSLLSVGAAIADADCPAWNELHAEESIALLTIGDMRTIGIRVWFVYVNQNELGRCILGEERYEEVHRDLIGDDAARHVFWIGVEGDYPRLFNPEWMYMIQIDQRFDVVRAIDLGADNTELPDAPPMASRTLVAVEGTIDFAEPLTIFHETQMGARAAEYWFAEKYLDASP